MSLGAYIFICKNVQKDLEGYKPEKSFYLWRVDWFSDCNQGDSGFYCLDFNHYKTSLIYYLGN